MIENEHQDQTRPTDVGKLLSKNGGGNHISTTIKIGSYNKTIRSLSKKK